MSEKSEHARLEAFCDGVFAIAITLLILEIKIPPIGSSHSIHEFWIRLVEDWPSWFGFILSFVIILVAWVNHHNIFKFISKSSPQFIYANGLMLFSVVVIPFAAGLMSEYLTSNLVQPAVTVYCCTILLHNISWVVFGWTSLRPKSLYKDRPSHEMFANKVYKSIKIGFLFYFTVTILSFWFPISSMTIMTVSWLYWVSIAIISSPEKIDSKAAAVAESVTGKIGAEPGTAFSRDD